MLNITDKSCYSWLYQSTRKWFVIFTLQVFQIKLKNHCSKPIKLQKFLMQQYKLCNLLDPHAKNPNYTFEVRACAVNFSSLIFFAFARLFFCLWALTVLHFQQEEVFAKSPKFKKCISRHFRGLVKQDWFHWNIFQLKLHYLLPIFSFMFH